MTLPVGPDLETVLDSCIETLRDVVLPGVEGDWQRYSAELIVGSLEYAKHLSAESHNETRHAELSAALREVQKVTAAERSSEWAEALAGDSPFVSASRVLVACQNSESDIADRIRAILHPVLDGQLEAEMARTMGLFVAFVRNMQGAR